MFKFFLLSISDFFFYSPSVLVLADNITVGKQSGEDWYLAYLKFFKSHEEVIDMTVLSLHDKLYDCTG